MNWLCLLTYNIFRLKCVVRPEIRQTIKEYNKVLLIQFHLSYFHTYHCQSATQRVSYTSNCITYWEQQFYWYRYIMHIFPKKIYSYTKFFSYIIEVLVLNQHNIDEWVLSVIQYCYRLILLYCTKSICYISANYGCYNA